MINYYTCIPGYSCNNACIFCTRPNDPNIPNVWGFIPDKTTEQLFKELTKARKSFNGVILTGGEPAIRKDFFEILQKCVDLGFEKISIQTNAKRFADKNFAERTVSILGDRADFFVSFHSHRRELFNKLSGTKAYDEALTGLKNLLSLSKQVRTNTVVMKPNYRELPEIASFLCGLGVKALEFMSVHPNGMAWVNNMQIVPKIEDTVPFVRKAVDVAESDGAKATITCFPLCALGDYRNRAPELFLPEFMIVKNPKARTKGKECEKCKYYRNCWGLWTNYLKMFDFKFTPFS